jgi:hypothetical protein
VTSRIHQAMCLPRSTQILVTSALLFVAPACGAVQSATAPARQTCAANRAQSFVGEAYSLELADRARQAAGAREVRKIEPGGAYTTDLDSDRLNIEVDHTGIVTGLRCG